MLTRQAVVRHLPRPGEAVLCAVSGGLDSMCLLHLLDEWCRRQGGAVTAAHFNHCLRPAADADEDFVRRWCAERSIPFVSGRGDAAALAAGEGLSLEEAARRLRYAFLRAEAGRRGIQRIYTAHHASDNAETVLLHLVRGTGVRGLAGMRSEREGIVRPFLEVSRQDLAQYAAAHGIPHVEDETNADPAAADRNLLRLEVLPLLEALNPRAVDHINAAARQLATLDDALEAEARRRTAEAVMEERRVALPIRALREAPEVLRPRMVQCLLDLLGAGRKDLGAVHLEGAADLALRQDRKERQLSLPHGVVARRSRETLILERTVPPPEKAVLVPGRPVDWGGYTLTLLDRREGPGLALRVPHPEEGAGELTAVPCPAGAYLTLPGANGSRSVKRLCRDRGISPGQREALPAVLWDGRLAAVWQLGVDTEFLPEGPRLRFLQIKTKENGHEK